MIPRRIAPVVMRRLSEFPAVALLGPCQVGKTPLARTLVSPGRGQAAPDYLDLANPAHLAKLSDPLGYLRSRQDRLVIIDEVQRLPGLFHVLRGIIDDRVRRAGRRGTSCSLARRLWVYSSSRVRVWGYGSRSLSLDPWMRSRSALPSNCPCGYQVASRVACWRLLDELPPPVFGGFTAYEGEVHDPRGRMFYAKLDGEF
jgi:hypothetical protein